MLEILPLNAFDDNYIWCITKGNQLVVVDPGDEKPVVDFIERKKLILDAIIITHHHYDHVNGIPALINKFPSAPVFGPYSNRINGITKPLRDGESIQLLQGSLPLKVMDVPGHTREHIAYHNDEYLFCGDTLFSAGCGRMFEGTPTQFWDSLSKLKSLADDIKVYCTHEYTEANINFARYLEPSNTALAEYMAWVKKVREVKGCTLPTSIKKEKRLNPFLRCDLPEFINEVKNKLDVNSQNAVDVFAAMRAAKDNF